MRGQSQDYKNTQRPTAIIDNRWSRSRNVVTDRVPRGWPKEDAMKTTWEEDPTELLGLEEEGGPMEMIGSEDDEEEEPTEMMSLGGEEEGEEDDESFDLTGD
jgi:hypothetical protein